MQAPPLKSFPLDPFNEGNFWGGSGLQKKRHQYGWMFCFALPPWKLTYPHKFDGWKMICPLKCSLFKGLSFIFRGYIITSKRGFKRDGWNIVSTWGCWFFIYPKKTEPKELNKTPWIGGTKILPVKFRRNVASVVLPWPSPSLLQGPIILLQFWGHVKTHIFGTKDLISHVHPLHGSHRIDVDPETFVEHGKFTFKQRCVRHIQCPYYIDPIPI